MKKRRYTAIVAALALFPLVAWAGISMDAYSELPGKNATLPSEQVTNATGADSTVLNTPITSPSVRRQACGGNTTVCAEADLSGAAGDTVVLTFVPYHVSNTGTVTRLNGMQTVTATAGSNTDVAPATQITAAGGRTITFAENTPANDTVTASSGSFVTDGYEAGMTLAVASSSSNDGDYLISSVTALVIMIAAADDFAAEGPLSATTTLDASGDNVCPALFFEIPSGCNFYEIRHAAPSAGNVDITWSAYGVDPQ